MFRFVDVPAPPVPSLLRDFSAPVKLRGVPLDRLQVSRGPRHRPVRPLGCRAAGRDRACCSTGSRRIGRRRRCRRSTPTWSRRCARPWPTPTRDPAFAAEALALPSETTLADEMAVVAVEAIHAVRESARAAIGARARRGRCARPIDELADPGPYRIDGASIGRRALRNVCLAYLAAGDRRRGRALAKAQFDAGAEHDRRARRAVGADRHRRPGARRGARRVLPALGRRSAGDRQMVCLAGALVAARHDRARCAR